MTANVQTTAINVTISKQTVEQIIETLEILDASGKHGIRDDEIAYGQTAGDFLARLIGYERKY